LWSGQVVPVTHLVRGTYGAPGQPINTHFSVAARHPQFFPISTMKCVFKKKKKRKRNKKKEEKKEGKKHGAR